MKRFHFFNSHHCWDMEPITHQSTIIAMVRFQFSRQPGHIQVIWRSHGQFHLKSRPVQYPWLNPLFMLTMNLQNVDQHHFPAAAGPCDIAIEYGHYWYTTMHGCKSMSISTNKACDLSYCMLHCITIETFPPTHPNKCHPWIALISHNSGSYMYDIGHGRPRIEVFWW